MADYWFMCKKCETLIKSKKDSYPNSNGCPKGSGHLWTQLAEVGDVNFQCKKCGALIQAKKDSCPNSAGCPKDGGHYWARI